MEGVTTTTLDSTVTVTTSNMSDSESSHAQLLSQLFLFAMTLGLSATVEFKYLRQRLSNTFAIACGVGLQYTVMPLAGLLTVWWLRSTTPSFTPAMGLTLLVLCCSPGGSYSTWWVAQFNADLALSVAMTTISSILGVVLLPVNLYLSTTLAYGTQASDIVELIDFGTLLQSLAVVVTAIGVGLGVGYVWDTPQFHDQMNRLGNVSGLCLVALGLYMSHNSGGSTHPDMSVASGGVPSSHDMATNESSSSSSLAWPFYVAVALPCLIGIILPNFVAHYWLRVSKPQTVAIAIECCYQNKYVYGMCHLMRCV